MGEIIKITTNVIDADDSSCFRCAGGRLVHEICVYNQISYYKCMNCGWYGMFSDIFDGTGKKKFCNT